MKIKSLSGAVLSALAAVLLLAHPGGAQVTAGNPVLKACDNTLASSLKGCFASVSARLRKCYLDTGSTCLPGDAAIARALTKIQTKVASKCTDGSLTTLGYGMVNQAGMIARLQEACRGNADAVVARTFGGPQAVLLAANDVDKTSCAEGAQIQATNLIKTAFAMQSACVRKAHKGGNCDPLALDAAIARKEAATQAKVTLACPFVPNTLVELIGLDEPAYTSHALEQSRCMTAEAHADVAPLSLDCGPRASVPRPPRDTWTQVVLPNAIYGTKCGDGSDYAFWIRLAPAGKPVEKMIINLQGGGVCIFDGLAPDCSTTSPDLFEAMSDYQPSGPTGGWLSTNASENPFSDYTMVALPYCTQDVFFGGGVADVFSPTLTVYRYGAVNTRATLRYVRDVVWGELDATTTTGYRPDVLRPLFGGESAGGFGTSYNYHYLLDDLRWTHTTAVPDSGLALDNGGTGVLVLGAIVSNPSQPTTFWNPRPFQPPYCLTSDCGAITQSLYKTAVRLKAVPEQQILTMSNQVDNTQRDTTFFSSTAAWVNAMRAGYCSNEGLNGVYYYLPPHSGPIHTMLQTTSLFDGGLIADGLAPRDWLANAVANPNGVSDAVQEGTLVTDVPGVNPFPCTVDP